MVIFAGPCTHTLKSHPYKVSVVHYGMSVVKAVVHSEFLPPFVQGLRGCKIS